MVVTVILYFLLLTPRRAKYDPFLLLELIERHGGTVH